MSDTRVQVFLGKGGVGKTTCSAATALRLAERGEPSLVISTDPTPSLSHIFEIEGEHRECEVRPRLHRTEFGRKDVRNLWDERFGREVYGVFSSFVDIDYRTFVEFVTAVLPGMNEEFRLRPAHLAPRGQQRRAGGRLAVPRAEAAPAAGAGRVIRRRDRVRYLVRPTFTVTPALGVEALPAPSIAATV